MPESDHRQTDNDLKAILDAVSKEVDASVRLAILQHERACPVAAMKLQHDRMFTEMFNGDDGEHGFFAEMRSFVGAWRTRTGEDDKRKKRRWVAAAVIVPVLCVLFAEPAQVGWKKIESLSDLAGKAPDIIKLTEEWKAFYAHPPVHPMDPPPIITPPEAQPFPKKQFRPRKPKTSFFEYDPRGVGLLKEPTFQTTTEKEDW